MKPTHPVGATTTTRDATPRTTLPRAQNPAQQTPADTEMDGNPTEGAEALTEAHSAPRVWTLTIPAPAAFMSLNDRPHWARRAKLTRLWRGAAHVYARQAKLPCGLAGAHVQVSVVKATARSYDVHNLMPTAKAAIDGLIDYGLLADDSNEYLTGPDLRPGGKGAPALVITVTEKPAR